jgi:amidase
MVDPTLMDRDAVEQARMVRDREVAASDLVEAAIARIEERNPAVNAVTLPCFEHAREEAALDAGEPGDGPFRGVPILLKDLGIQQEGLPYTMGNRALRDAGWTSPRDTPMGRRFRDAGFITLGKTSTPEFGAQPTTQPHAYGPCRNPWDLDRSTSGSSGGAAAAVAAGMVAVAHANDGYGSIRDPASWCGLVGLKPGRGRMTIGEVSSRNAVAFVVSRSVRDTAAALDALHGSEPGELYVAPEPEQPYADEVGRPFGRPLRVGLMPTAEAIPVDPECTAAVEATGRLLESLGHHVALTHPQGLVSEESIFHMTRVRTARVAAVSLRNPITKGWFTEDEVEPYSWAFTGLAAETPLAQYIISGEWQQVWSMRMASWWEVDRWDVLVTPATGRTPMRLDELAVPDDDPLALMDTFQSVRGFAAPLNVTGQPAISLPLHWTTEGLPLGVQLVSSLYREDVLIRLASHLEEASPWRHRRAPMAG